MRRHRMISLVLTATASIAAAAAEPANDGFAALTNRIAGAGIRAGLVVHVGNEGSASTLALARDGRFVVHRLVPDAARLDGVRAELAAAGPYGSVSAEAWARAELPYAQRLANVVIVEDGLVVPDEEIRRVLAPGGLGLIRAGATWRELTQPFPAGMDGWTHLKHGADGNPVSRDTLPFRQVPNSLRWVNDALQAGSSAMRLEDGRLCLFFGGTVHVRDAFNGVLQWRGEVGGNPVLAGGRLHTGSGGRVTDAATGRELLRFDTGAPYEYIVSDGVVLARGTDDARGYDAATGKPLWTFKSGVMDLKLKPFRNAVPATRLQHLAAGGGRVYFTGYEARTVEVQTVKSGGSPGPAGDALDAIGMEVDRRTKGEVKTVNVPTVFGLDARTGKEAWRFQDAKLIDEFATVILVAGETLLLFNRSGYVGLDTTGKLPAWFVPAYDKFDEKRQQWVTRVPVDPRGGLPGAALYIGGLIWLRDNVGDAKGPFAKDKPMSKCWAGLDPRTGAFKRWIGYPPAENQWSGRCYWDIGGPDCVLAQTLEIVTVDGEVLAHVRGVRGQCGMGFVVGHHAVFTSPNVCIYCYPMVRGAVSYELPDLRLPVADGERLEKGPAYGAAVAGPAGVEGEWPMYRGSASRTSAAAGELAPGSLGVAWESSAGGRCTQPVVSGGRVVTAAVNRQRVLAFDAGNGAKAWEFVAGGRIDTSPTLVGGRCLFGAHDGFVYCLRLDDGRLIWRFNAAPRHRRIVAGDQVSSPWPVVGSVLPLGGAVYASAGYLTSLDGGLHLWALDPETGTAKFHRELTSLRGEKATIMPSHWYLHQEDMLNNILLGAGNEIRLYDQHGGWELSAKTGELVGQSKAVPQPGWPKGRLTPGDFKAADRWPWCGWDRVTMIYLLRGEEPGFGSGVGMDPRNRWADWYKGLYFVFPDRGRTGVQLGKGNLSPLPWVLPQTTEELTDPKVWRASEGHRAAEKGLWPAVRPGGHVGGMVFAGDTLWVASGQASTTTVQAVSMKTGALTQGCAFPGTPTFDGVSVAGGRLFVACNDGRVVCLKR